jgi:hypothetical protein
MFDNLPEHFAIVNDKYRSFSNFHERLLRMPGSGVEDVNKTGKNVNPVHRMATRQVEKPSWKTGSICAYGSVW